jgi:hypothetical protein
MTRRRDRGIRGRQRLRGAALDLVAVGPGPGDPLVRALVTCLLEAHARRATPRELD